MDAEGQRGYELLDCGAERRLERFGARVVDRPAPAATEWPRLPTDAWAAADLRFDKATGWSGADRSPWTVDLDGLVVELVPTSAGQVGLYPEHRQFWPWLTEQVAKDDEPSVLHLFASTGATTLALARAGARVTHVDGARSAVAWGKRNASRSGLDDAAIRWIVDDALAFTRREARRGRVYDGIVLDPPSFGHGPGGTRWDLRTALPELLDAIAGVATPNPFLLLTAHTTGLAARHIRDVVADVFADAEVLDDDISVTASSGAVLPAGVAARIIRR